MGKSRDRATRSGSDPVNIGTSRLSVDSGNIKVTAQDGTTFKKIFAEEVQVGSGNNRVIFKRGSDGKAEFQSTTDGGGSTSSLQVGGSGTVTNPSDLPISGNSAGDTTLVTSTNNLMIYNGSGWYKIATITNASPTISSAGNASYAFETDGTPVTVEIVASDPEGVALQYKYQVTTGSLGSTATVTNSATSGGTYSALAANTYSNNRFFKVTPSTNNAHAGAFAITFSVTDGVNTANSSASSFTLSFGVDGSYYFDGSSGDELSIADSDDWYLGTGDFTIEAWVYSKSFANGFNAILAQWPSNGASANNSWVMETVGSELDFYAIHGGTTLTSHTGSITLDLNKWYHVAVQRSSGTIKSYINGVEDFSISNSNDFNNVPQPLTIGGGVASTAGGTWNGYISNARIVKGSTVYTPITTGAGLDFGSSNSTLTTTASHSGFDFGTNDFTIEFFYKWSTNNDYQTVLDHSYNAADGVAIQSNTGTYKWGIFGSGMSLAYEASDATAGVWHHYAFVRNGNAIQIYRDGVQTLNQSKTGTVGGVDPTTFGGVSSQNDHYDFGKISNFRVVKGTALYTSAFTPPTAPLTAISGTSLLLFQENSGSTLDDASTNNVTITKGSGHTILTGDGPTYGNITVPTSSLTNITNTKLLTLQDMTPPGGGIPSDASSSSHTITKTGDIVHSYATPFAQSSGGSTYLDGTGDYLSTSTSSSLQLGTGDFTIEYWIYPTNVTSTTKMLLDRRVGSSSDMTMNINGSIDQKVRWYHGSNYGIISDSGISTNTWYHIALVRSSASTKMYINGVAQSTTYSDTNNYQGNGVAIAGSLTIPAPFQGYMSNYREVVGTAVYTTNFTPSTTALTAVSNTKLLTMQNSTGSITDASSNSLTITANGDAIATRFSPF